MSASSYPSQHWILSFLSLFANLMEVLIHIFLNAYDAKCFLLIISTGIATLVN